MELIFDIGANVGNTVATFSTMAKKVIAFEPNPNLANHLNERFKNSNIIIDNRGLSDSVGKKIFNISESNALSTFSEDWMKKSRFSNNQKWDNKVEVSTTTLDAIIEQYGVPDLIKVDVEGYELEVFNGFSKFLENTIISFEWAEEEYEKILLTIKHIKDIGYKNFSFTYGDAIMDLNSIKWDSWENLSWHKNINIDRKTEWGMIYFKK